MCAVRGRSQPRASPALEKLSLESALRGANPSVLSILTPSVCRMFHLPTGFLSLVLLKIYAIFNTVMSNGSWAGLAFSTCNWITPMTVAPPQLPVNQDYQVMLRMELQETRIFTLCQGITLQVPYQEQKRKLSLTAEQMTERSVTLTVRQPDPMDPT